MKRSKKELSTKGSIKRNSLVRTSKDSGRRDSRDETRSIISRDGSKQKSKKGKSGSRKKSSEKAESLPKIIENFEEEAEELLIEEMDLWHSLEELIFSSDKPGMLKEKMYPKKLGVGGRDECEDICNQKCLDSRIRLPPIKRTNSENILWDIRGLPGSQPVESIPVLVVDRVNVRRKERHDNILMQLSSKMNEVNEIIEKEIRKQAENVVAHINLIKENVDNILDIIEEKQCIGLSKNVINRMQEIMKQLNDNRLSKIDSFCNFIRKLEAQRSESFKHILKKVYKDMHDNMYLLPYEIQKFFENKIQHLNQITMNNYHCYTELEGKLKLQMEEEMRIWFQKLKVYEKIKKKKTTAAESPEAAQEADEISAFDAIREKKKEMSKKLDDAEANFQDLLKATSMSLYLKSHHILDVYRTYLTEMMHVATSMIRADLIDHSEIQLGFASIHALSVQYGSDEVEIRDIIRAGIRDMTQSLDSNLKNFSHSTRIFDGYIDRMLEMTELCQKQLLLTVMRNDKATMRMNANINILVDKLRQDSSESNLDKTLNEIMSIVSNIDAMLLSNLKEEVSVVDKVHQLTMLSVDVMIDEIGRFVEQIPPPTDSDPRVMKKRASWLNFEELKNNDHLFSEDFMNCRFMIDAINNWQFGIWQVLITVMDYSKQAISNIVQEKNNNKKRKLKYRCELKMKINNLRMQSIKEDFYKVRLTELKAHDDRLKQHRMGVEDNIMKLNHLHKEMELLCRDFIDTKYMPKIMNAMSLLEKVTKKRHLNEIKQNVRYLHSMIRQEMKPTYDRISSAQFQILTNLKNSHLAYLKSIRFFSEDGNFTVDEVKNLKKQMGLLEKRLTKEFNTNKNTITKTYDAFVEECRNKRKAYLHSLDKSIEEFTFKEDVEHNIKELNSDIRSGIYDVIYEVRNLETKFKNLKGASYNESNIGDMEWMPTFFRCFSEIQADIESIHDKLAYFDWAPSDDKFLKRRTLHSPIDSMVSAKSSKSISEVQKSQSKLQENKQKKNEKQRNTLKNTPVVKSRNYMHILYPSLPEPEDSFLSKLHCKIFSSFSTIQEMAKIFYDKHDEIMNKDLVIPEYKSFIEEVLAKYKYYQLQLEFVWLECIAEFIKLITNYQKYLDDYYKDTLIKYFEVRKEQLKKIYEETIKNLEDNIKSIEEYYMNAHGKLKTMFGHPNMSNMLTTIEQYITKADGFAKKVLLNNLMPCKENIKDHCANTESTFLDLEQILSCIKGSTKSISLKNDLENQLLEKTERMQRILSLTDEPVDEEVDDYHVVQSVAKKLKVYKDKAQIPPEIEISYTNIIKSRCSSHSSIRLLDTELLLKENYGDYEIYCEKIDSFQEKCNAIHQKYKTIWKQDIERIIKLYQVKYNYSTIE